MTFKKKVINSVKWNTISSVFLAVVAILKLSVLTRFLDKSDFGLMAIVMVFMGFVELFNDMGLSSAILFKKDITKRQYSSLFWLNLVFSGVIYLIILAFTPILTWVFNYPILSKLIPLIGLIVFFNALGRQFRVVEQKQLNFKNISIVEILGSSISLCSAIVFAINGYGVYSLVYSLMIQVLFTNLIYLFRGIKLYGLLFHFRFEETKSFLKIGVYQVGGQVTNFFSRDIDILLIGKFFTSDILGGYNLARELVRKPIALILPIVNKVGTPALVMFNADKDLLKTYYLKLVNIVASISIPLCGLIALFAPYLVEILYGEQFLNIVIIVQILTINMFFRMMAGVFGNLVVATGRTDLDFKWNIITLFVSPLFVFLGALTGKIELVALFITFGMMILFIPAWYYYAKRLTGASLSEYLKASFMISYKFIFNKKSNGRF